MDPPGSECVCVFVCVCACMWETDRQRERKKNREKELCLCCKGGCPFSHGSSQVQDVLSQIVWKHIWQSLITTLLLEGQPLLLLSATTLLWVSAVCIKHGWYLQRSANIVTQTSTICQNSLETITPLATWKGDWSFEVMCPKFWSSSPLDLWPLYTPSESSSVLTCLNLPLLSIFDLFYLFFHHFHSKFLL